MHLRILTYNVQARPAGLDNVDNEYRSTEIARRVLASAQDYDIVCFNEVFDEDTRGILLSAMEPKYPHHVAKVDGSGQLVSSLTRVGVLETIGAIAISIVTLGIANAAASNEDSGLMVFSRFPIDLVDETLDGVTVKKAVIRYERYTNGTGWDALSDKGVLAIRFVLPDGSKFVIAASHTQADDKDDGANQVIRRSQIGTIESVLSALIDESGVKHDFVVLGDLNVDGIPADISNRSNEWGQLFAEPGSGQSSLWWDSWTFEQSPGVGVTVAPGSPPKPEDRGTTALTPHGKRRYDYHLTPPKFAGARILQHAFVDHVIADTTRQFPYLSDHLPFALDVYRRDSIGRSVRQAKRVSCTEAAPIFAASSKFDLGSIDWYYVDIDGTYDFWAGNAELTLYGTDNLSRPLAAYLDQSNGQEATKYVLPAAPIFIKVSHANRYSTGTYRLTVEQYLGTSFARAIELPRKRSQAGHHKPGTRTTSFDATLVGGYVVSDARYYGLDVLPVSTGELQTVAISLQIVAGSAPLRLLLCRDGELDPVNVLGSTAFSTDSARINLPLAPGHYFVMIERQPSGGVFGTTQYVVSWDSDVTIAYSATAYKLYKRPNGANPLATLLPPSTMVLNCVEETDSPFNLGSDDIAVGISADSRDLVKIPNSLIGDFDTGDARPIDPWVTEPITYVRELRIKVSDIDDISADDVGMIVFRPRSRYRVPSADVSAPRRDESIHVTEHARFDGGEYSVQVTLA